jgi:predicted membrane-bound spermidine synthase
MAMNVFQTILGGFTASIAWFIVGGALYMNPLIAKIYKDAEDSPALKKWPSVPRYISLQYIGILAQCLLWAFVFALVKPVLPGGLLVKGIVFGLVLTAVKIFPRFFDMWIQSTYPNKLLGVEFINGTIGSFVIGVVFAYVV